MSTLKMEEERDPKKEGERKGCVWVEELYHDSIPEPVAAF